MPEIFVSKSEHLDELFNFLNKVRKTDYRVIRRDRPLEGKKGVLAFFTNAIGEEIILEAFYQQFPPIKTEIHADIDNAETLMAKCLKGEYGRFHDHRGRITGFVDHVNSTAYVFDERALEALSDETRARWVGRKESSTYEYATYIGMKALFKECPELERMLLEDQMTVEEVVGYLRRNLKEHVYLKQHPGSCIR